MEAIYKDALNKLILEMRSDVQMLELMTEYVAERDVELMQGMKRDLIQTQEFLTETRETMAKKHGLPEETDEIYWYCMQKMDKMLAQLNKKLAKGDKND